MIKEALNNIARSIQNLANAVAEPQEYTISRMLNGIRMVIGYKPEGETK